MMMSLILKSTYFSANVDLYSVRLFFLFSTGRLKPVKKPKKKKRDLHGLEARQGSMTE